MKTFLRLFLLIAACFVMTSFLKDPDPAGISLKHREAEYEPALAAGDINGDGFDDVVCSGGTGHSAILFLQQPDGRFLSRALMPDAHDQNRSADDAGVLLFDADKDYDLDLYTAGKLFINDGQGNFSRDSAAIAKKPVNTSCVRAADYDKDGDPDLFIGGRAGSFIYRNDSKSGKVKFTDVTRTVAPAFNNPAPVHDAVWTDFGNDGWSDLLLAGEGIPVRCFKNSKGVFTNVTAVWAIGDKAGRCTSMAPGDFDNDGDMDYVVGNLALNASDAAGKPIPVFLRNNGRRFDWVPLPAEVRAAGVYGMVAEDFNRDGFLDVLINDGGKGLLLLRDSTGFQPQTMEQSGIGIPGNGKALIKLLGANGQYLLAAAQDRDSLKTFALQEKVNYIQLNPLEVRYVTRFRNGTFRAGEPNYGASFRSQSHRLLVIDQGAQMVLITDSRGKTREVSGL